MRSDEGATSPSLTDRPGGLEASGATSAAGIIDCDVHPLVGELSELRPYMSARAARRVFGEQSLPAFARDPNRIPHPTSGHRLDAAPPNGGPPGSDPEFALEQWISPYDISAAVLIPVQAGVVIPWGDESAGSEFLHALNRYLIDKWVDFDSRYRLLVSVSPYDIKAAVSEVERFVDTPGVVGIFIPHGSIGLGRSHFDPLYEVAQAHNLPVVLHPTGAEGNLADGPRVAGGLPHTYPERHSLLLHPGQAILASAIFGGVFDRFPTLKLVLSEYGFTWVGPQLWRMDDAWERGAGKLAGLERRPSSYVRSNVRFTSQPLDEPGNRRDLVQMLELADVQHTLMFSSDYPHWDTDDPTLILSARLPREIRDGVRYATAVECFGEDRLGL